MVTWICRIQAPGIYASDIGDTKAEALANAYARYTEIQCDYVTSGGPFDVSINPWKNKA